LQVSALQTNITSIANDASVSAQFAKDMESIQKLTPGMSEKVSAMHDTMLPQLLEQLSVCLTFLVIELPGDSIAS
jgi:hypothetical protein